MTEAAEQAAKDYERGLAFAAEGSKHDDRQAAKYFSKVAKLGHIGASYYLGLHYFYGEGIRKDLKRARELLTLAAD